MAYRILKDIKDKRLGGQWRRSERRDLHYDEDGQFARYLGTMYA